MKAYLILALSICLTACSDGGSSSKGEKTLDEGSVPDRNVAASENGASVTTTNNSDGELNVIDGDTSTSLFWSGDVTDDALTVDFGLTVDLSGITLFISNTNVSTSAPKTTLEISEDGNTWLQTAVIGGGEVSCISWSSGSGRISCGFKARQKVRYIKVTITATDSPELIKIYEIEAMGK